MHIGYARGRVPVTIGQQRIKEVDRFTYLGSVISADGDADHDVVYRIGNAAMVMRRLQPLWRTNTIALETKVRLFNSIVIPTATYACEPRTYTSHGRDTVSRALSASAIRDGVKHGQMRLIHSHPPHDTVLRRAPRSLGSALMSIVTENIL